ncbi:MAG: ATP-binding protein, partial [Oscillospiraceae bacterium]|nr:ATP-binding protein [Oscillospiraceae bacterium]
DGQVSRRPDNVLIYATSNRRHIVRESWRDRQGGEDIFENDTQHEKLSLSERFGIHLYFPVLSQAEYFAIIEMLLRKSGVEFTEEMRKQAAAWAMEHNGRSGRSAKQYAAYVAWLE